MRISILVDNLNSWALPHAKKLRDLLSSNHEVCLIHSQDEIMPGEIAIFLSCEKLVKADILKKNRHNLVAHASPLPQGKGWSPLTWQILAGMNDITISLFEAAEKVDAGPIYDQAVMHFEGHELIDEMQDEMGRRINELIIKFVDRYPENKGIEQSGDEFFYKRRSKEDSELDPQKTIADQFNLLRIVHNEKYPAFFKLNGKKYILKIFKSD